MHHQSRFLAQMDTKIDRLKGPLLTVKLVEQDGLLQLQAQIMDLGGQYQRIHLTWQSSTWYASCFKS
jgi:hypothetical protein